MRVFAVARSLCDSWKNLPFHSTVQKSVFNRLIYMKMQGKIRHYVTWKDFNLRNRVITYR